MNEKAKFAVKTLRKYDRQTGVGVRNTSDLSPLEQWLIIELLRVKNLAIHDVVVAKPENANVEVLAIMGTLVRTLSRLDNNNPDLLLEVDKKRLLKGKETLTEWCEIDPKDIPKPSSL